MSEYGKDDRVYRIYMETLAIVSQKRYTLVIDNFLKWTRGSNPIFTYKELSKTSKEKITPIMQDYLIFSKERVRNGEIKHHRLRIELRDACTDLRIRNTIL